MIARSGFYALLGWQLVGCDRNLNSIEGFDLGQPKEAVWAKDAETDRVMVVASDQESLCDALAVPGAAQGGTWTLSVWSKDAARYEAPLPAESLASIRDGVIDDDFTGEGELWLDDGEEGDLQVRLDVMFGEDRVRATMKAVSCGSDLFVGLR